MKKVSLLFFFILFLYLTFGTHSVLAAAEGGMGEGKWKSFDYFRPVGLGVREVTDVLGERRWNGRRLNSVWSSFQTGSS